MFVGHFGTRQQLCAWPHLIFRPTLPWVHRWPQKHNIGAEHENNYSFALFKTIIFKTLYIIKWVSLKGRKNSFLHQSFFLGKKMLQKVLYSAGIKHDPIWNHQCLTEPAFSHLTDTEHRELEFSWSVSAKKCLSEEVAAKSQKNFRSLPAHCKRVPILRDLWFMGKNGWRRARKRVNAKVSWERCKCYCADN